MRSWVSHAVGPANVHMALHVVLRVVRKPTIMIISTSITLMIITIPITNLTIITVITTITIIRACRACHACRIFRGCPRVSGLHPGQGKRIQESLASSALFVLHEVSATFPSSRLD